MAESGCLGESMIITHVMIGRALHELETRSEFEIERTTAMTWGARAVAALRKGQTPHPSKAAMDFSTRMILYAHHCKGEALEHGALAELGYPGFLEQLIDELREVP